MGVDLRVEGSARVLPEERGDDSFGVDDGDLAADAVPGVGVSIDPVDECFDGSIVRLEDSLADLVVAECEEHGHGLRCRAGDVETSDRRVAVLPAEVAVGPVRVAPVHDREEVLVVEFAGEAEFVGGDSEPLASGLVGVEVVPRELLDVVPPGSQPLQRRHPDGHHRLPDRFPDRDCALVCFGWVEGLVGSVGGHGVVSGSCG